ncbi:MAG: glycosyltransferase [Acutalibacteraceae bacterium]
MKKILFMLNSLHGGGAEKVFQNVINNLDSKKYEIILYTMHPEKIEDYISYKGKLSYNSVFNSIKSKTAFGGKFSGFLSKIKGKIFVHCSSKTFYRLFIREKADVEIAFIEGESTKIISGSTNKKSKKYAWVHTDLEKNPWTEFLYRSTEDEKEHYLAFDKILCVSDSVRDSFIRKYHFDGERVRTQYNPLDRNDILKKSEEKTELSNHTRLRMITVGRLVEQKGYDRLIRIADRLKKDGFSFELLILGEGTERAKLEKMIRDFNLEKDIILLGFQENPYCYMKESDLFVCSSRTEGFSTVVSEAIVLGLPVISTDCAGVHEVFGNFECGIITKNDEDDLFEALFETLSHPERLKYFAEQSTQRGKCFSLEKAMKEIENLLDA